MKIHEFQAKQLLEKHGIPIPRGGIASTPDEAVGVAQGLGKTELVIKAQVHAGGRRAGHFEDDTAGEGGVRLMTSVDAVRLNASQMLGHVLVTKQTGPVGREVRRVYIEEACEVQREIYLGMLVHRRTGRVTLMASNEGGSNIESAAASSPESVFDVTIDPLEGLQQENAKEITSFLNLDGEQADAVEQTMRTMYDMFHKLDASLIEINPLAITSNGGVLALDATLRFDDNALFRHEDIQALNDEVAQQLGELKAAHHGLNYIKLDGDIGCMASGAGLAMATLDVIKLYGGAPANFLDVPPVSEVERVKNAFKLVLSDPGVKAIVVNVFGGGIMRCDSIADGIVLALREMPLEVPLVVRLAGVNADLGLRRLKDSGLAITFATDMGDAAEKAVKAAKETKMALRRGWWHRVHGLWTKPDEAVDR
jgi:succinyl-CoA synthetase beta subunit